jgi:hydrogenase maturation protein HypF
VAPATSRLGVLLAYTPLHHLLARGVGRPVVLTSGNVSDEPIAFRDDDARARLAPIADAVLSHNRPIQLRADDSVVALSRGGALPIRRSRGYAPAPLALPVAAGRHLLGCGAELKSTFTLARGGHAFVSHHIGDLENAETLASFTEGIAHLGRLLAVEPEVVVHDLHPEYLSTKWALDRHGVQTLGVQHHHAHLASCLADNGERGPVIGVAFDGLGYGPDATLWGGEVLLCDLAGFSRFAHLEQVPLPGGATAVREPWRMALSWLLAAHDDALPTGTEPDLLRRHPQRWPDVAALCRSGLPVATSSVGRLFDAVAALCGVRDVAGYEGQAAIELEQLADPGERGSYPLPLVDGVLRGGELIRGVVSDVGRGMGREQVAARFHRGLAAGAAAACAAARAGSGLDTVALSGGVFQNQLLSALLVEQLEADGFRVLTHRRVPPNDGGISLGQVAIGAVTCS